MQHSPENLHFKQVNPEQKTMPRFFTNIFGLNFLSCLLHFLLTETYAEYGSGSGDPK
jgi:hypothetical protein